MSDPPVPSIDGTARVHSLAAAAVAAIVLLAGVYGIAVQTRWGQRLDVNAVLGRYVSDRASDSLLRVLDTIGIASLVVVGGTIMLVAVLRRRPYLALAAGVLILGSNVTTQALKRVVLPRPQLLAPEFVDGASFPSGHTTVAMSLAVALVLVVPRSVRGVVALCALAYPIAVGAAVVSVGWHRPSDVCGAYLVVFAWATSVCAIVISRRGTGKGERSSAERWHAGKAVVSPALLVIGLGLLGLAVLIALGVALEQRRSGFDVIGPGYDFGVAILAIVGTAAGLTAILLWLLRGISLDAPDDRATTRGLSGNLGAGGTRA